jgi:hypothetical protein
MALVSYLQRSVQKTRACAIGELIVTKRAVLHALALGLLGQEEKSSSRKAEASSAEPARPISSSRLSVAPSRLVRPPPPGC